MEIDQLRAIVALRELASLGEFPVTYQGCIPTTSATLFAGAYAIPMHHLGPTQTLGLTRS